MFTPCNLPPPYTKQKCMMTAEARTIRPVKSFQCRSKKKLPIKLLVRQEKQEKENKSPGDHLTLNERFKMLDVTADLKKFCPSVKREYSTYQPMTDEIYTRWERKVVGFRQNLPLLLDIDSNQPKSKVGIHIVSSENSCPAEVVKMPISSVSPLLLRKDIAAIVTDNISTEGTSTPPRNADKRSASTSHIGKDSASRRNRPALKGANIMKARNRELSVNHRHSRHPDFMVEEGSQSTTPVSFCSSVLTPGTCKTNLLFDKEKAWNRKETEAKNAMSTQGLLIRKMNFSFLTSNFGQDSKNESVSKSIFQNDMDLTEFRLKEKVHGNPTPKISLWYCP